MQNYIPAPHTIDQARSQFWEAERRRQALKNLKRLSKSTGMAVLGFFFIQFLLVALINPVGRYVDESFWSAFFSLVSFASLFLPFFYIYVKMSPDEKNQVSRPFEKSGRSFLVLIAIPAGFMFCMAGNYIVAYFVSLMDSVGVKLSSPELNLPSGYLGAFLYIVQIAFMPALIEEFALRAVVMQPLRRYGDGFAIVMSSVIFALMHGNMIQAPFALIAGLAIGYFVVATGSIWTGVLIHFANNLFSALTTLLNGRGILKIDTYFAIFMSLSFVSGIACCVIFALNSKRIRLKKNIHPLNLVNRSVYYLSSIPMLLALAAIAYFTAGYIHVKG